MFVVRRVVRNGTSLTPQKQPFDKTVYDLLTNFSRSCRVTSKVRLNHSTCSSGSSIVFSNDGKISGEQNDNTMLPMKHIHRTYATRRGMQPRKPDKVIDGAFKDFDLDPTMFKLGFEDIEELKDADEKVKKIFSLEYASRQEVQFKKGTMLVDKVREDEFKPSHEAKIAILTVKIRNLAEHMKENKKDKVNKRRLYIMIDRRNQLLGYLRRNNYDRFKWLLEELGIQYSVPPIQIIRVTKRQLEERSVTRKAYFDRKKALYEYFKQKIDDADAEEKELMEKKS
ncbi:small ribosomal subunit protein uS15m-like [Glandiceps talaboti]